MASIDDQFQKFINYLITQGANSADYLRDQATHVAEDFGGKDAPSFFGGNDPNNAQAVHNYFSRQNLYQDYINAIVKQGQTNDAIAAKLQADFLVQLEREYKAKRVTRVRSVFMAASRRYSHGNPQGVIQKGLFGGAERWVKRNSGPDTTVGATSA